MLCPVELRAHRRKSRKVFEQSGRTFAELQPLTLADVPRRASKFPSRRRWKRRGPKPAVVGHFDVAVEGAFRIVIPARVASPGAMPRARNPGFGHRDSSRARQKEARE